MVNIRESKIYPQNSILLKQLDSQYLTGNLPHSPKYPNFTP